MEPQRQDELLDLASLAKWLGVHRKTVGRMVHERRLPKPIRIGGVVRWRMATLRKWTEALEVLAEMGIDVGIIGDSGEQSGTSEDMKEKPASGRGKPG